MNARRYRCATAALLGMVLGGAATSAQLECPDINRDGVVNSLDLNLLLADFGKDCPSGVFNWAGLPGAKFVWTDPDAWVEPGFPNGPGDSAVLGDVIDQDTTIILNQAITLNALTVGDDQSSYILGVPGGSSLIFENDGLSPIELNTPTLLILCGDIIHSCLEVVVAAGGQALFSGNISGVADGPASLIMPLSNEGTVSLAGVGDFSGEVVVQNGVLELCASTTIPDDVPLIVDSPGTVFLKKGVSEVVGALIINGQPQPPGVYPGGPTPRLAGPGEIVVQGGVPCPGPGDCCQPNGTPGCNDASCCQTVCAIEPFCCDVIWDGFCAQLALELCGCPPFVITDVFPDQLAQGDIVTILGSGFGDDPDALCVAAMPLGGGDMGGVGLRALEVSDSQIQAVVRAVPEGFTEGVIAVSSGEGSVNPDFPLPPDVIVGQEPCWFWLDDGLPAGLAGQTTGFVPTPPVTAPPAEGPGTCFNFTGGIDTTTGELVITLSGTPATCPPGTQLFVQQDAGTAGTTFQFDGTVSLTTTAALTNVQCANTLCAALQGFYFSESGMFFSCTSQVIGPDQIQISVGAPGGAAFVTSKFYYFNIQVCVP